MARKVSSAQACSILDRLRIPVGADPHVHSSSKMDEVVAEARKVGYRKPKNANGSTGRYFHEYLQRLCRREARWPSGTRR